ncbi:MAG: DUF1553 domain-containing protein [Candidatus Solibacter usitatus]|nr:DUF1553 domain-containing protein [Candidatus Solibacter usitatus]
MVLGGGAIGCAPAESTPPVEFNRDIRPILSDKCYTCHGPDPANRKSKLRFDTEAGAKQDLGGRFAIMPGDPSKSEIIRRLTTDNQAMRMPPAYAGAAKLGEREIGLVRRWIEQGARWQKHWSFIPLRRPDLPRVSNAGWPRDGIDYFVLERLEREGLRPSPEAARETLIRRVSLDLNGLPPTPAEIDAFLNDASPNAYEKVVDRLLASPRYGERMAARWLDAARYADTNGYQTDAERFMWRWRDWVIDAFNRNKPFDRFTIEQLAGDLLPHATADQIIATGFNRNHRGNGEGGIIPEEYAVEYVVDRVETTSTVWLGLTMGCTRCHDHKYDPFTQKEFYQLYGYFNNIPERGKAFKYGNSPPLIPAPTPRQQEQLQELEKAVAAAEKRFSQVQPELAKAQREWEKSLDPSKPLPWLLSDGLVAHYPLDGDAGKAKPQGGDAQFGPGRIGQAAHLDGKRFLDGGNIANFGFYDAFTLAAWIYPAAPTGAIVSRAQEAAEGDGYGLHLKDGKVYAAMVQRWLDDGARVETERKLEPDRWHQVTMTYDGSRFASGIKIYIDGEPQKVKVLLDDLNQNFGVKEPLRIGAGLGPENRFRGWIDEVAVYSVALTPEQAAVAATSTPVTGIAALAPANRSRGQADKLAWCFLDQAAPAHLREAWKQLLDLRKQRQKLAESFPTVMVMQERPTPAETHLLIRGAYDRPGEKVTRATPSVLPPLPPGLPNDRLGLAKWLVDPSHPLTARVAVNRYWQMYFGTGLVKTVEDFGSQGEWPAHPALLDWLATEFIRTGWDVKALQKTIVMSAAYRQASRVTPELLQKDPENRLFARGPRVRLAAEVVRDQALAVSGLLVERIGGPSVKPYQPAGLWKELAGGEDYKPDHGENLYRRSLYTFWKRASAPPSMMLFDSAGREACTVRESRTNTPLQALTLMNDVTYVEASRALAQRMMTEAGPAAEERIAYGFRLVTARRPTPEESRILLAGFHHHRDTYQTDLQAALKLVSQGESPRNEKLDVSELAAYTSAASLILNLDETITKE